MAQANGLGLLLASELASLSCALVHGLTKSLQGAVCPRRRFCLLFTAAVRTLHPRPLYLSIPGEPFCPTAFAWRHASAEQLRRANKGHTIERGARPAECVGCVLATASLVFCVFLRVSFPFSLCSFTEQREERGLTCVFALFFSLQTKVSSRLFPSHFFPSAIFQVFDNKQRNEAQSNDFPISSGDGLAITLALALAASIARYRCRCRCCRRQTRLSGRFYVRRRASAAHASVQAKAVAQMRGRGVQRARVGGHRAGV